MKVGDYIRTENGIIAKCYKYEAMTYFFDKPLYKEYGDIINYIRRTVLNNVIIKSSPNIIDLIEVGDYVNGYLVTTGNQGVGSIYIDLREDLGYRTKLYEKDIKSIVTKEQFESMEYKI